MDAENNEEEDLTDIDQILPKIGGYGRYQMFIQIAVMVVAVAEPLQGLMMFYAADTPSWIFNDTGNNTTYLNTSESQATNLLRCSLARDKWQYTKTKEYSIVTEFDLDCDNG